MSTNLDIKREFWKKVITLSEPKIRMENTELCLLSLFAELLPPASPLRFEKVIDIYSFMDKAFANDMESIGLRDEVEKLPLILNTH